jgi:hypothetical protein
MGGESAVAGTGLPGTAQGSDTRASVGARATPTDA